MKQTSLSSARGKAGGSPLMETHQKRGLGGGNFQKRARRGERDVAAITVGSIKRGLSSSRRYLLRSLEKNLPCPDLKGEF